MTLGKSSNINNPISIAINSIPPNPMNCELRRSSSAHVLVLMYAEVSFLSTVSSRFIRAKTSSNDKVEFVSHGQKQVSVEYCGDVFSKAMDCVVTSGSVDVETEATSVCDVEYCMRQEDSGLRLLELSETTVLLTV